MTDNQFETYNNLIIFVKELIDQLPQEDRAEAEKRLLQILGK